MKKLKPDKMTLDECDAYLCEENLHKDYELVEIKTDTQASTERKGLATRW
jgi:hypothetical protein